MDWEYGYQVITNFTPVCGFRILSPPILWVCVYFFGKKQNVKPMDL